MKKVKYDNENRLKRLLKYVEVLNSAKKKQ